MLFVKHTKYQTYRKLSILGDIFVGTFFVYFDAGNLLSSFRTLFETPRLSNKQIKNYTLFCIV